VAGLFADAEVAILRAIAKSLLTGTSSDDWATKALLRRPQVRRAVSQILAALAADAQRDLDNDFARTASHQAAQARSAITRLGKLAPTHSRAKSPTVVAPPPKATTAVREVIPTVLRSTDDIYRKVVAQVLTKQVTTEKDRLDAVQRALNQLTRQGITGFVDKSGRRWNMTSYLEMATRTALNRAATDWYAHELSKAGIDLVRVSEHPRCAPQCLPFQGGLLSLSGRTRGPVGVSSQGALVEVHYSLAEARALGYNHPGCKHFLRPILPGDDIPPAPLADTAGYVHEQQLRAHERAIRKAKMLRAIAITPQHQAAADRQVRQAQAALRAHVAKTGVPRQRNREQIGTPR
jgi:hypothetical protein